MKIKARTLHVQMSQTLYFLEQCMVIALGMAIYTLTNETFTGKQVPYFKVIEITTIFTSIIHTLIQWEHNTKANKSWMLGLDSTSKHGGTTLNPTKLEKLFNKTQKLISDNHD